MAIKSSRCKEKNTLGYYNVIVMTMFSSCVCVCLSLCLGYNFWMSWHKNFIFGMVVHLDHIQVKFEYKGHWVKVKVISWKMLILLHWHQFNLIWLVWGQGHKWGQGHSKVKVILRSNCVWLSISKREVGLRLKGILVKYINVTTVLSQRMTTVAYSWNFIIWS